MKFDAQGNFLWSEGFGDSMTEQCSGIAVDGGDNVVITGSFTGTIDFGGGILTSAGNQDLFLAKFDSNGNHLWSQRFGDATWIQVGHSVDVDDDGNVVVSCECRGTTDFGGGPLTSTDPYLPDVTIAKFDASGSHVWSQNYGDENVQYGYGIAADSHGDVSVTGLFRSTVDFGGDTLTSAGGRDVFVVKFSGTVTGITPQPTGTYALRTVSYPNPFNPGVTIVYTLPMKASVRVDVYDMAGRHVTRLVDRVETEGDHVVTWDASGLASGVYLYRVAAGQYSATRKIVLLK